MTWIVHNWAVIGSVIGASGLVWRIVSPMVKAASKVLAFLEQQTAISKQLSMQAPILAQIARDQRDTAVMLHNHLQHDEANLIAIKESLAVLIDRGVRRED